MALFVILVWCHFVSPYNLGGSANSVLWRGRHFWKIARVNAKVGIPNFVSGPREYIMEGEYVILAMCSWFRIS